MRYKVGPFERKDLKNHGGDIQYCLSQYGAKEFQLAESNSSFYLSFEPAKIIGKRYKKHWRHLNPLQMIKETK